MLQFNFIIIIKQTLLLLLILRQKADIKQVSAINSEITKSVRPFRILNRIKWEKCQLRGHEKQNQCANRDPQLCPSIFYRGSHNEYRQGAIGCPRFSVGPCFTTKSRDRNGKVYVRGATPTRCYKCQKFGHVATTFRSGALRCRLCAGAHMTEQCHAALRNTGQQVEVKCANSGQAHPASSGLCTKLRGITATKRTQAAQKFKPAPLPSTNAWGQT